MQYTNFAFIGMPDCHLDKKEVKPNKFSNVKGRFHSQTETNFRDSPIGAYIRR